uniref:Uncharacterized protein n=1 Tax=Anguilla anguilla TaxID=7936 RepID=A0A0E9U5V6_ANGAN
MCIYMPAALRKLEYSHTQMSQQRAPQKNPPASRVRETANTKTNQIIQSKIQK